MADGTFPALEELKREAEGVDVLVEIAPDWLESGVEWLFDVEYLARKEALLETRETVRERFRSGHQRIEAAYGSTVVRALERRRDGERPRFDLDRAWRDLVDATGAIDDLLAEVDEEYLTRPERRRLAECRDDVVRAKEYVRNVRHFERVKTRLEDDVESFESRYAPYAETERYMVTSDHEYLTNQAARISRGLADAARELVLHVLPDDDADWLARRKARFDALADVLPEYNEEFVRRERERYADLFETDHGPLNDRQQRAIVRDDRRNLVDASAGTGKTLTLTYRFLYLLEKGVPPSEIAAITFTRDAADEMAARIAAAADVAEDDLEIRTIHSFALRLVREATVGTGDGDLGDAREELVDSYVDAAMADDDSDEDANADIATADGGLDPSDADVTYPDCYADFREAFREFRRVDAADGYVDTHKPRYRSWEAFVREKLETFLERARTFDRSPDEIRGTVDESDPVQRAFASAGCALLEAYQRRVEESDHPLDFDEMIYAATDLVETYPEEFGSRYRHLLVDEFQDVSEATLAFVEAFAANGEETHLFCVGDDWQSIYGFNGSNVRNFTEYGDRFDDVTYTPLAVNYRCPPSVVRAGVDLVAQSEVSQNEKPVRAASDVRAEPTLHELTLYEPRQAAYVADLVEDALADGRDLDDVMVLSRNDANSAALREIRGELERRDVPHERPDYRDDYLPEAYRDRFDREIGFDAEGNAAFASGSDGEERPPMVAVRSIHASKGTEAPVVVLAHAVDDDPDGIPIEERTDDLLEPATDVRADRLAEERRLFYVALTRTEEEFHAVARAGSASRYVEDVRDHFAVVESDVAIEGTCTDVSPSPEGSNLPSKATLECADFAVTLVAWPSNDPPRLEEGAVYRIDDPVIEADEYGEEVRYDLSSVVLCSPGPESSDEAGTG